VLFSQRILVRKILESKECLVALVALCTLIVVTILSPWLAVYDPGKTDFYHQFLPPSSSHFFGTDDVGRDIFSRVLVGSRLSIRVAIIATVFAAALGTTIGAVAGFWGGLLDELVMRFTDIFLAFPVFMMAMVITAALGASLNNAMVAIIAIWWTSYARVMRGEVLDVKQNQYIEAAHAIGASRIRILGRHILPNTVMTLIVKISTDTGYAILWTASLSFLGLGASPTTPEWGMMVATGRPYLFTHWWCPTFPGLMIFLTVLIFTSLGDSLDRVLHTVKR